MSLPIAVDAVAVFAATNVDDIVVLTTLFTGSRSGGARPWSIVLGQYVGIAALFAVSVVASVGLLVIPDRWVGLLGVVPIALGVRGLLRARAQPGDRAAAVPVSSVIGVIGVTIANGADNISIYTPLFAKTGAAGIAIYAAVFAPLVAMWCLVAIGIARHKAVIRLVDRFGHWLVPLVFIVIGTLIFSSVFR